MIGQVVEGKYEIIERIGEGGFGTVYRCLHLSLDKIVAVKMLTREAIDDAQLRRFLVEGKNLAKLNHPNVVQIFDAGLVDEKPYLVMEYVEGVTLRRFLAAYGHTRISASAATPLSAEASHVRSSTASAIQSRSHSFNSAKLAEAAGGETEPGPALPGLQLSKIVDILAQVARGLNAIHQQNIIHRDLSVSNVMVTGDGVAKILDLGLSSVVDAKTATANLQRIAGTLSYIAPEILDGRPATISSDIFSFGVLAYETVSGTNPFRGEDTSSVLNNIANRHPTPLDVAVMGVPRRLGRLVEHCLRKDPGERLSSLDGVADQILRSLQDSPSQPVISPATDHYPEGAPSAPRNPYLNRVMIRRHGDFIGRKAELRRIYSRLNATPPGSVSIVGDRRIGKSSLLSYICMPASRDAFLDRPDEVVMIFLDLQQEPDMKLTTFVERLISRTQAELEGKLELPTPPATLDGMKTLVQELTNARFRLVILLDEFELVTTNPNFSLEFYSFLRFLANHYDVVYLTSSVQDLQALCHTREISDSPFFNIFSTMRLTAFEPNEARELVNVPSRRIGLALDPYYDFIVTELAGFFPMFLQIACSHLVDGLVEGKSTKEALLQEVRKRYAEEAKPHYQFIWDSFSEHEREVASLVAGRRNIPESLRDVLLELETKKYILRTGETPVLFSTTFSKFVDSRAERKEASGLKRWLKGLGKKGGP
jgi:serine/threonine protein kinase